MIYLKWLLLAVANVAMLLLAYLLAPLLPSFSQSDRLPRWLAWFDTPDNTLDGDAPFQALHAPFPGIQTGWRRYVNRVFWLWRNPSYGFDLGVLGVTVISEISKVGPSTVGGALVQGWYFAQTSNAFQLYAVWRWGNHASRINFGWKLWSAPGVCQFALTVNPVITVA